MTKVTHLCPNCGSTNDEAAECWTCHTEMIAPSVGLTYEYDGGEIEIIAVDGTVLTDSDGGEYTVDELAAAIEYNEATNVQPAEA